MSKEDIVKTKTSLESPQKKKDLMRASAFFIGAPILACGVIGIIAPQGMRDAVEIVGQGFNSVGEFLNDGKNVLGVISVGAVALGVTVAQMWRNGSIYDTIPIGTKRTYVSRKLFSLTKEGQDELEVTGPDTKLTFPRWRRFKDNDALIHPSDLVIVEDLTVAGTSSDGKTVRLNIKKAPLTLSYRLKNAFLAQKIKLPSEFGEGEGAIKKAMDVIWDNSLTRVVEFGSAAGKLTPDVVMDQRGRSWIERVFQSAWESVYHPEVGISRLSPDQQTRAIHEISELGVGTPDEANYRALGAAMSAYVALPGYEYERSPGIQKLELPSQVTGQMDRVASNEVEADFWGGRPKALIARTIQDVTRSLGTTQKNLVTFDGVDRTLVDLTNAFLGQNGSTNKAVESPKVNQGESSTKVMGKQELNTALTAEALKRSKDQATPSTPKAPPWFGAKQ